MGLSSAIFLAYLCLLVQGLDANKYSNEKPDSHSQCYKNPPNLNASSGVGHVQHIGGLTSYVSGCSKSKLAVLLASDIFGYEAPNLRLVADKVAAAGYYVVVPDFLRGDPFNPQNADRPIQVWIQDHQPIESVEDAKKIFEFLKKKGIRKIGAAGFCWGGKLVVELAKDDEVIQAAVLLHPSAVTLDDIRGVKVPIAILGAENDQISPPVLLEQFEEALNANPEVDGYVKIFPGVEHGWTLRYNPQNASALRSAEEAHNDMLGWLKKYIN